MSMIKANLSEFKEQIQKMGRYDKEMGLIIADEILSKAFEIEKDEDMRLALATAIYSIRGSQVIK